MLFAVFLFTETILPDKLYILCLQQHALD